MVTESGNSPVISAVKAALVAAAAQAPVVQPRRSGPEGFSIMVQSNLCCKNLAYPVILSQTKKM
jgi:hypothetical protein